MEAQAWAETCCSLLDILALERFERQASSKGVHLSSHCSHCTGMSALWLCLTSGGLEERKGTSSRLRIRRLPNLEEAPPALE